MNIIISNSSDKPIYEQIIMQIKGMIIGGELKSGDFLPSMRNLAKDLRISVITTKRAYEELEREGFIETVTGKGSFVAARNVGIIREQQLKNTEEFLKKAIETGKSGGIGLEEMKELIEILYREE